MKMQVVDVRVICEAGQGVQIAQDMINSFSATDLVFHHSSHIGDADDALRKEMIRNTPRETLDRLMFVYQDKIYELTEADMDLVAEQDGYGYDIYEEGYDDPINLGQIAYFDTEPTQQEFDAWMDKFQTIEK
jgi:hypothetical protein